MFLQGRRDINTWFYRLLWRFGFNRFFLYILLQRGVIFPFNQLQLPQIMGVAVWILLRLGSILRKNEKMPA